MEVGKDPSEEMAFEPRDQTCEGVSRDVGTEGTKIRIALFYILEFP